MEELWEDVFVCLHSLNSFCLLSSAEAEMSKRRRKRRERGRKRRRRKKKGRRGRRRKKRQKKRRSRKSWAPFNNEPIFFIAQLLGLEDQESFHLHDGQCQAERESSVPLLLGGRPSQCKLLSWQREEEPEILAFQLCYQQLLWEATVRFCLVFKWVIAIMLRRSERKQLGAEIGTDLTQLSRLPKEDPNDLKSIKIGFPKVPHQEIFEDEILCGEFDYKRLLTGQ